MEEKGVWRTVRGRRIFIKDGQSLTDAMRESGKFDNLTKPSDMTDEEIEAKIKELEKEKEKAKFLRKNEIDTEISMLKEKFDGTKEEYLKSKKEQLEKRKQASLTKREKIREQKIAEIESRRKQLEQEIKESPQHKVDQYNIIQEYNPMLDDYHLGIRSPKDIKTFDEVINDDESFVWGDFSKKDAEKALKEGNITIYSSYPIKQGTFVSTSKRQSEEYAGGVGSKVYSKKVPLEEVAWINGDEGQYAKIRK